MGSFQDYIKVYINITYTIWEARNCHLRISVDTENSFDNIQFPDLLKKNSKIEKIGVR